VVPAFTVASVADGVQIVGEDNPNNITISNAIKLTAEARLKGEKLPDKIIIPSVLITKENAKEFYFPDSPF
jgi:ribose transport system substrate-binding protein